MTATSTADPGTSASARIAQLQKRFLRSSFGPSTRTPYADPGMSISAPGAGLDPKPGRRRRFTAVAAVLALTATFVLAFGVTQTRAAAVAAAPTWPIPADAPAGPPPVPLLPAAGDAAPPSDQIADPVTADASCGRWYLQDTYGDRWPASSTWWEYRCSYETTFYSNPCTSGACDAFCWYCYWETQGRTDYFHWDGSDAVFDGEAYSDSVVWEGAIAPDSSSADWWDAATARWYRLGPYSLTVSKAGAGSGAIASSPAGISCGDRCQTSFAAGTVVTLTADPDATSTFAGWSGDCSGTGSCQVTLGEARSVTATFTRENFDLSVSKAGSGSGQVSSSPAGISCGATCQASFEAGTHVTLSATPAAASRFSGWSGDCVGTGDCTVTLDQARSVTATFAANAPPRASFTYSCSALTCSFDAGDSADSDGSIVASSWYFGDGTSSGGTAVNHAYATAAGFTVTLKVTDNEAASDTTSQQITLIDLTARGSKVKGLQRVELSWSGASGASFNVYRDGSRIASGVQAMSYTDNLNRSGSRSYSYRVCAAAICSNPVMVTF